MLSRLLETFRGRGAPPSARAGEAAAVPVHAPSGGVVGGGGVGNGRTGRGASMQPAVVQPEIELPPAAELLDEWRHEVARVSIELRERYPMGESQRNHAERLLVKLAVDLEVVVHQPSQAAQEAFAVAGDPSCGIPELVRVVGKDPALAAGLLRHAASALYGGFGAPASVDDAVRRLGSKGVQIAVLAGMAGSLLARGGGSPHYGPMASQVWAHMVRTGPRARALARATDVAPQEAFTLGLLHDVGKLVLFDLFAALREEMRREIQLPEGLAGDALRRLHQPLGGIALLRWGVESRAAWAVATHHRDPLPELRDRRSELIFLAERLDLALTRGTPVALDQWYAEGALTVPRDRVAAALEQASLDPGS